MTNNNKELARKREKKTLKRRRKTTAEYIDPMVRFWNEQAKISDYILNKVRMGIR